MDTVYLKFISGQDFINIVLHHLYEERMFDALLKVFLFIFLELLPVFH